MTSNGKNNMTFLVEFEKNPTQCYKWLKEVYFKNSLKFFLMV